MNFSCVAGVVQFCTVNWELAVSVLVLCGSTPLYEVKMYNN